MSAQYLEKNIVVGPFQCNCRVIVCPKSGEAAVIDPGDEPGKIVRAIESMEWGIPPTGDSRTKQSGGFRPKVKWLLHTHAHLDHIGGTRGVREAASCGSESAKIALHRDDLFIYEKLRDQGMLFGMSYADPLPPDHFLTHEEELTVGSLRFTIVHTPGHSPGSLCLRLHEDSSLAVPETLFSGDTLFQSSVGRTDLWGADGDQMMHSIRDRILTLDGDTRVCPGHGPETRVGIEKHENPFLRRSR